jgi:hypothetical protein
MAHFAKLDTSNRVLSVEVVDNINLLDDNNIEQEEIGIQYLIIHTGWSSWKKTSFNTFGGKHYNPDGGLSDDQSKAFRKNYAAVGMYYDQDRDAFIMAQPHSSWILNEETCLWDSPVERPEVTADSEGNTYLLEWDDINVRWLGRIDANEYEWNPTTQEWVLL